MLTLIPVAVGTVAALISSVQFIPQVLHTVRQRHDAHALAGVSIPTFLMLATSTGLWLTYGILKHDPIITAPNVVAFAGVVVVLTIVIRARRRNPSPQANPADLTSQSGRSGQMAPGSQPDAETAP